MKSIIFHYSVFHRGGAEKSTLRLMRLFANCGWDVSLMLNFKGGTLENEIPENIKVRYLSIFTLEHYQNKHLRPFLRLLDYMKILFMLPVYLRKRYELACIGLQGLNPFFVCNVIRAKKKVIFIRSDISQCQSKDKITKNLIKYSRKIDQIVCVSETARESVNRELPIMQGKTKVVYNVICPEEMLLKLKDAENPYKESDYLKVLTVCRMEDHAKGLFRMLDAYDRLYANNIIFEWYFVGDGADLQKMKEYVKGKPYETLLHFEGEKSNPFPYYKFADLVAILSYYEGLSGVVNEAKVSGAAVMATEFSGIHEQITHGKNGWIVENNLDSIIDGLSILIEDAVLLERIRNNVFPAAILDDQSKIKQMMEN